MLPLTVVAAYLQMMPSMKRFNYSLLMFRVTLGLIGIADYIQEESETMALHRILNIVIGCALWLIVERIYFFGSYASTELRTYR